MTDDLTLLASTYLDGEATPDERARVEGDAALLAEVERLRQARAALLDARWFERPGDDVREATVAAALAAWDAETGLADSRAPTGPGARRAPVVSFERRRAYTRWLTAAAAVAAVAGLGVVVAQSGGDNTDDASSTAIEAASETIGRAEAGNEFDEQSEPPSDTEEALSDDAATDAAGGEGADADVFAEAPSAEGTEAPSQTMPAAADMTGPAPPVAIETPQQLAAYAAEARAVVENDTSRATLSRPCPDEAFDDIDSYVAMGMYRELLVIIGIDDDDERAIAVDPATCEVVAEASLP
jgi:hypothetical protein